MGRESIVVQLQGELLCLVPVFSDTIPFEQQGEAVEPFVKHLAENGARE